MRLTRTVSIFVLPFLIALPLGATTFVVPDDAELVAKSPAIVVGQILGSSPRDTAAGIETLYRLHIDRAMKGPFASGSTINIISLGGTLGGRFTIVASAAHFEAGEHVLLFLTPYEDGWTPTDLTIGKFRYATSPTGSRLLVRDAEEIVGWDRDGKEHVEPLRREAEFLRFVENRIGGRAAVPDYLTNEPAPATQTPVSRFQMSTEASPAMAVDAAPFPSATYTNWFLNGSGGGFPARWPNMAAGVRYFKNASQNASGLGDGGVSVIQSGIASWNNECQSLINMIYAGTTTAQHNTSDATNVVLFNDPQGNVPGSWTGSGTIAITFGQGGGFHTFDGRSDWVSITDEDLVFQDGFPGTHQAMPTAMTHELGHSIGWRHSNAHYQVSSTFTDQACQPAVEECSNNAIMFATSIASLGYTLQTWDVNAAQAVYPGGSCTPPPPPPSGRRRGDVNGDSIADIVLRHTNGSNFLWLMNTNGDLQTPLSLPPVTPGSWAIAAVADFDGDGRSDIFWRDPNGNNYMWLLNGNTLVANGPLPPVAVGWNVAGTGDFNADGKSDILWRNVNGSNYVWLLNGISVGANGPLPPADPSWRFIVNGDITGDGKADVVLRQTTTGANFLWTINDITLTTAQSLPTVDTSWDIAALGDFNGDAKSDIFWRRNNGENFMWLLSGASIVGLAQMPSISDTNWRVAAWGDFNGDGKYDIFWRHSTGQNFMWLLNGTTLTTAHSLPPITDTGWQVAGPK